MVESARRRDLGVGCATKSCDMASVLRVEVILVLGYMGHNMLASAVQCQLLRRGVSIVGPFFWSVVAPCSGMSV